MLLEAYYKLDPDTQPIGIYAVDTNGVIVEINHIACRLLRNTKNNIIGNKAISYYQQKTDRERHLNALRTAHKNGDHYTSILPLTANNSTIYLLDCPKLIIYAEKEFGVVGFLSEITTQEKAARLLAKVPTGVYIADASGKIRYANSGLAIMLESPESELLNTRVQDYYLNTKEYNAFSQALITAINDGTPSINRTIQLKRKSGQVFFAHVTTHPFIGPDGEVPWREGIVSDIHEAEQINRALRELPGFYQLIERNGIYEIERCSTQFATMFGFSSPQEAVGWKTSDLTDDPEEYKRFEQMVFTQHKPIQYELRVHDKTGKKVFYIAITAVTLRNDGDHPIGRIGTIYDIGEKVRARRDLEKFRLDTGRLHHSISMALIRVRTALRLARDLIATKIAQQPPDDILKKINEAAQKLDIALKKYETEITTHNAPAIPRDLQRHIRLFQIRKTLAARTALQPSTYRRLAEGVYNGLCRLQHEIQSPTLCDALKNAETIIYLANLLNLDRVLSTAEEIDSELRLSRRRLAPFHEEEEQTININALLDTVIHDWVEYAASCHIQPRVKVPPNAYIKCRTGEMTLALSNLYHNAIKYSWTAQWDEKEISRTHERFVSLNCDLSENNVIITIKNLGVAITKEEIDQKLFLKPGFRGKFSGSRGRLGTGLGVSYSEDVVRRCGGTLCVESKPAKKNGRNNDYTQPFITTVTVKLPITKRA